jgi:hypothetical protein
MKRIEARARVIVTVELSVGMWGTDCTVAQVFNQAGKEALMRVERILRESRESISIIGSPQVKMVMGEEER